jgi:hypothetical protein
MGSGDKDTMQKRMLGGIVPGIIPRLNGILTARVAANVFSSQQPERRNNGIRWLCV